MTHKILIAYASNAGSTAEIATTLADELRLAGMQVDVSPIAAVNDLGPYDGVLIGAPMIIGWHRAATKFLKTHQLRLSEKVVACFITSLELSRTGSADIGGVPVFVDPNYPLKDTRALNFREKRATEAAYLQPILRTAPAIKPVSAAFFRGALDYGKLHWYEKLFVRFLIRAKPGDYRNWEAIRAWAASLRPLLAQHRDAA